MIYFSDDFNFKPDNFPALFAWLKKSRRTFDFDRHSPDLKKRWGDYKNDFTPGTATLDEIIEETHQGHNLFEIYEPELLFACSSSPLWLQLDPPTAKEDLVRFLFPLFPRTFSRCRSAAIYWLDHWRRELPGRIQAGISFGGSLIYARAFARVLEVEGLDNIFVEHFFTGHDFYFEKRLEPLPNDSLLRNEDYCRELAAKELNPLARHLKIQKAQNKNVRQPTFKMPSNSGYVLLLGQVANDFSILSRVNPFKNSVGFYQKVIDIILDRSELDLVIKTHPYETRKLPPGAQTTQALLRQYLESKPAAQRRRVSLVENQSLTGLINRAAFALTLNSQAGLETLLQGKRLICLGQPFYADKGFTHDLTSLDQLVPEILTAEISLSVVQFEKFLDFLDVAFEHLVGQGEEHKIGAVLNSAPLGSASASRPGFGGGLQNFSGRSSGRAGV